MSAHQPIASSSRIALPKSRSINLDRAILERFRPAKVFADAVSNESLVSGRSGQITSLAFDSTGERCVSTGEDDALHIWDSMKGKEVRQIYSKKYGAAHARFTHRSTNIIYASTKLNDNAIRYQSIHDNKYLAYFKGHTGRVRSLHMNPTDDTFLSAGDDGTVRLWDLRSPTCKGLLNDVGGSAVGAFDNTGMVFAVACAAAQTIMLYSAAEMDKAPFLHAPLIDAALEATAQPPPKPLFTSLTFSNNGLYILIGTKTNVHYVLDAFTLGILRRLVGHRSDPNNTRDASGEEVSWSADSQWVVSGSADGNTCLWDLTALVDEEKTLSPALSSTQPLLNLTAQPSITLRPGDSKASVSRAVAFNPRLCMIAVGSEELSFWLPARDDEALLQQGW